MVEKAGDGAKLRTQWGSDQAGVRSQDRRQARPVNIRHQPGDNPQEERSTLNLAANNPWGVESSAVINVFLVLVLEISGKCKVIVTVNYNWNHLLTFYQNLKVPAISKQVEWAFEVLYLFYFN